MSRVQQGVQGRVRHCEYTVKSSVTVGAPSSLSYLSCSNTPDPYAKTYRMGTATMLSSNARVQLLASAVMPMWDGRARTARRLSRMRRVS
jgi:hypothetical protein